jgi:hypothetical protein
MNNTLRFYTMISCNGDYVPTPVPAHVFSLTADADLEAIDAKMEALYETDTIMMEATLNEPEDYDRPYFDEDDYECCSECNKMTEIVAYGWRTTNDNLCFDCVNLPGMYAYEC